MVRRVIAELALAESRALQLDLPFRRRDRHREPFERPLARCLDQRLALQRPDAQATTAPLNSVHCRLQRELQQRLAVEVRRKRLTDPADLLAQAHALLG